VNGDVSAGAHDDAEIGLGQRGGIIDPVADHGDHPALGPQMAHDLGLLPGLHRRCPITGDEDDEKRSTDKNSGFTGLAPSEMAASQAVKVPEFDMPTTTEPHAPHLHPMPFRQPGGARPRGCSVGHPKRSGPDQLDGERCTRRPNSGRCPNGHGRRSHQPAPLPAEPAVDGPPTRVTY
jgi:hypothetical protein